MGLKNKIFYILAKEHLLFIDTVKEHIQAVYDKTGIKKPLLKIEDYHRLSKQGIPYQYYKMRKSDYIIINGKSSLFIYQVLSMRDGELNTKLVLLKNKDRIVYGIEYKELKLILKGLYM